MDLQIVKTGAVYLLAAAFTTAVGLRGIFDPVSQTKVFGIPATVQTAYYFPAVDCRNLSFGLFGGP
jgi:hypothetical protein